MRGECQEFVHPTKGASANWKYAQDISAAFEVVNLLQDRGDCLSLIYQKCVDEPFDKFFLGCSSRPM